MHILENAEDNLTWESVSKRGRWNMSWISWPWNTKIPSTRRMCTGCTTADSSNLEWAGHNGIGSQWFCPPQCIKFVSAASGYLKSCCTFKALAFCSTTGPYRPHLGLCCPTFAAGGPLGSASATPWSHTQLASCWQCCRSSSQECLQMRLVHPQKSSSQLLPLAEFISSSISNIKFPLLTFSLTNQTPPSQSTKVGNDSLEIPRTIFLNFQMCRFFYLSFFPGFLVFWSISGITSNLFYSLSFLGQIVLMNKTVSPWELWPNIYKDRYCSPFLFSFIIFLNCKARWWLGLILVDPYPREGSL